MYLGLDLKGNVEITKKLNTGANSLAKRAIFLVINKMETLAKQNISASVYSSTPSEVYTRSGKAQQSIIGQQSSDLSGRVYMGVNYGKYLEGGTGIYAGNNPYWTSFGGLLDHPIYYQGMEARPFWAPAIKETKQNIPVLLKKAANDVKL